MNLEIENKHFKTTQEHLKQTKKLIKIIYIMFFKIFYNLMQMLFKVYDIYIGDLFHQHRLSHSNSSYK